MIVRSAAVFQARQYWCALKASSLRTHLNLSAWNKDIQSFRSRKNKIKKLENISNISTLKRSHSFNTVNQTNRRIWAAAGGTKPACVPLYALALLHTFVWRCTCASSLHYTRTLFLPSTTCAPNISLFWSLLYGGAFSYNIFLFLFHHTQKSVHKNLETVFLNSLAWYPHEIKQWLV